jgi:hypothetical protein
MHHSQNRQFCSETCKHTRDARFLARNRIAPSYAARATPEQILKAIDAG